MRSRVVLALCAVVVVFGVDCSDPRLAFVGSYKGTETFTTHFSDGTHDSSTSEVMLDISAPKSSDRLEFSGRCGFTAVAESDQRFVFDKVVCPTVSSTSVGGVTADYTYTYTSGSGVLEGRTITLTQTGTELGSHYADGSPNATWNIDLSIVASRL